MLAMVPGPVKAVVLLYPIEESGDAKSKEEDERLQLEGQPKIDDTIFWVKQKIPNACGTIGLIHAIANVTDILPYCCTCQTLID
jgi:ubiquitin carboxyl-terminal hydrolase L3